MKIFQSAIQEYRNSHPSKKRKYGANLDPKKFAKVPRVKNYLAQPLPAPPTSVEFPKVGRWGPMGNFDLGDCVYAFCGHAMKATAARIGNVGYALKDAVVIAAYWSYCKVYSGGKDDGADPLQVLTNWTTAPMFKVLLPGWGSTDPKNVTENQQWIAFGGAVGISVNLPASAETQFNNLETWDYDPTANNKILGGHQMCLAAYKPGLNNKGQPTTLWGDVTWAAECWITQEWIEQFAVGNQALVTAEIMRKPEFNGINTEQLVADCKAALS
jgi:hypothetical protein